MEPPNNTLQETNSSHLNINGGRCISYWNSPCLGDMLVEHDGFQKESTIPGCHFQVNHIKLWEGDFKSGFAETNESGAQQNFPKMIHAI